MGRALGDTLRVQPTGAQHAHQHPSSTVATCSGASDVPGWKIPLTLSHNTEMDDSEPYILCSEMILVIFLNPVVIPSALPMSTLATRRDSEGTGPASKMLSLADL